MKTKVKICGIKTLEAAKISITAGADFLGFNFVPTSKRYIKPEQAKKISDRFGLNNIRLVGVFQDEKSEVINKLIDYLKLDLVQLHGDESPEYLGSIKNAKIIKTLSLPANFDVKKIIKIMRNYKADYFLLDREVQGKGEMLNLEKVHQLTSLFPIILAGGLTASNVGNIVRLTKPYAVDVAAGVETNGIKDKEKIINFTKAVKKYD